MAHSACFYAMKLCKHERYRLVDWILDPKWSTEEVLINVKVVNKNIDHYLVKFVNESPAKKYGWFYLSRENIINSPTQSNGRGKVFVVDLNKREEFEPIKNCHHLL